MSIPTVDLCFGMPVQDRTLLGKFREWPAPADLESTHPCIISAVIETLQSPTRADKHGMPRPSGCVPLKHKTVLHAGIMRVQVCGILMDDLQC